MLYSCTLSRRPARGHPLSKPSYDGRDQIPPVLFCAFFLKTLDRYLYTPHTSPVSARHSIALSKGCIAGNPICCPALTSRDTGGGEATMQSLEGAPDLGWA